MFKFCASLIIAFIISFGFTILIYSLWFLTKAIITGIFTKEDFDTSFHENLLKALTNKRYLFFITLPSFIFLFFKFFFG